MKDLVVPDEILLTVDAMTGQDIVTVAKEFNEQLSVTGLIVTKMDGDARGGGLLSVRSITNVPVLFVSNGEKVDDLEEFHPDRMADRILGMGDIVTLVEQAQDDLLAQLGQVSKMGSMQKMMNMIPGINKVAKNLDDEKMNSQMKKSEAIILSMTEYERENPSCLKASRKNRIAKGAGVKVMDVNRLINQLEQMQMMTKMMSGKAKLPDMSALQNMQRGGGMPGMSKHAGSKKQKSKKKKKKK